MAANQPFHGYVQTTEHALRLVLAARQGIIPRIHRRLNEKERAAMIKSGAIFVFSTDESSIKRWTDGYLWSPSRIVGNFLVYREVADRQGARGRGRAGSSPEVLGPNVSSVDESSKRSLDQANLKPGGMFKKTITVVVEGCDHHLVAYYTQEDLDNERLPLPSTRQDIMDLDLPPHIFRLNAFRIPPKVSIGKDGNPYLVA
ncbi:Gti1/Pac2 family-domain-containing protein [Flagelloscypha sp. PMI_526]|nr:Gti1/Pac2 family-domain-containing protein [Flagelloscypha sp. PMI_526]